MIIVSYNSKEDLAGCLPTLLPTLDEFDELIIVDNASMNGSVEWLTDSYPGIKLICCRENLGFAGGNNLGANHANGRYLAFLNPDTLVEQNWLEALISALDADPRAGLATSKVLQMDQPNIISACGNEMHFTGLVLGRGTGQNSKVFDKVESVPAISGASFAIRNDFFQRLDAFDDQFFMYMEDSDLSLRTRLAGYKCVHIPQSKIYHDYALSIGPQKIYLQERNRYIMLLKNYHWLTLLVLIPSLFLTEVVTWGFVLMRDRRHARNKLCAYWWVLKNWEIIKTKRAKIQQLRQVKDRELIKSNTHRLAYEQTGQDAVNRVAHLVFDPLFYILKQIALFLVWW